MKPVQVAIVRPEKSLGALFGRLIGLLAAPFFKGWLLMMLIPVVFHWHPGYWQVLALVVGIGLLQQTDQYLQWTHEAKP